MPTDLFGPPIPAACRAYINIRNAEREATVAARTNCEALWRDFEPYADEHFRTQFQLHFRERWFEMYLTVTMIRAGLDVACPKPGPDIRFSHAGRPVWIEMICPGPGAPGGGDSVPQTTYTEMGATPTVTTVPIRQQVLRLTGAIEGKRRKFDDYREGGIVGADDVCIIAVSFRGIDWMWADAQDLMLRAVYGQGDQTVSFAPGETGPTEFGRRALASVRRTKGAQVPVTSFVDSSMPLISAVISSTATCPISEAEMGRDLIVWPNLTADRPVPVGAFPVGFQVSAQETDQGWTLQLPPDELA